MTQVCAKRDLAFSTRMRWHLKAEEKKSLLESLCSMPRTGQTGRCKIIKKAVETERGEGSSLGNVSIFTNKIKLLWFGLCQTMHLQFLPHSHQPPLLLFTDSHEEKDFCVHIVACDTNISGQHPYGTCTWKPAKKPVPHCFPSCSLLC